jgi:uncharacterized FlaG/YvyC family protein
MEIPITKGNRISPAIQESAPKPSKIREQPCSSPHSNQVDPGTHQSFSINNEEAIKALTESLNHFMKSLRFNLQFIPDREAGGVIIKVYDGDGNLIRRIPPEVMGLLSSEFGANIGLLLNVQL